MPAYVDLHSHFLPALDDGAKTMEVAQDMIKVVSSLGFRTLCATPHQRSGFFLPPQSTILETLAEVRKVALRHSPSVELTVAAENFWDEVFHARLSQGDLPCYPGGRAFLFEVPPRAMPSNVEQVLFQIRLSGRLPVMAHPERYLALQEDPTRVEAIGRCAALLIDLGSLDGAYGRAEMKLARKMVEDGTVHAAASDVHSPEDQRAVASGMAWIRKRMGQAKLDVLLDENPRRILAGDLPS